MYPPERMVLEQAFKKELPIVASRGRVFTRLCNFCHSRAGRCWFSHSRQRKPKVSLKLIFQLHYKAQLFLWEKLIFWLLLKAQLLLVEVPFIKWLPYLEHSLSCNLPYSVYSRYLRGINHNAFPSFCLYAEKSLAKCDCSTKNSNPEGKCLRAEKHAAVFLFKRW